ncbi:hypothetical protein ACJX0J_021251, partial [Zea mays]
MQTAVSQGKIVTLFIFHYLFFFSESNSLIMYMSISLLLKKNKYTLMHRVYQRRYACTCFLYYPVRDMTAVE